MKSGINKLSKNYIVKLLSDKDVAAVYSLCSKNTLYYDFCPPFVTPESIEADMAALPPGKGKDDKYYLGYYDNDKLIAVMDLILGYPDEETAYVGFFMTDVSVQGKGVGSAIISEMSKFICSQGYSDIQLGWVKDNPQAEHFWLKNGFIVTGKLYDMDDYTVVEARKNMVIPVTEENLSDAARIHSVSWQESHRSFCSGDFIEKHTVEHQKEYIIEKMKNGSKFYLLYDKEPVAVVSVNEGLIEDLYVLPEQQNRGYGPLLLNYVVARIQTQGLQPSLWILENNHGAERLYLRNGFVPSGRLNAITGKLSEIEFQYNGKIL
ncbi:GNAT family N-acetyltransferase [Pseudobutyrivibrio sp.]|uniref:GNAT family N-acetyltransferase n=1 Tax=Pseudobutyrivibrio sp. TaxID=2014367 RepID=UPI0025EA442C|nr:GNAT family N-acetyltransferase [Pseudobutyrivibrio sp.]